MNFKRLEEFMDFLTGWRIPGNACSVWVDGKQVFSYASGYASVESKRKMTGDERLYAFSATKLITATAALTLLERGKFILTDPIGKYLPEWDNMNVREILPDGSENIRPAKNKITVGDLFSMTSGLDYNFGLVPESVRKKWAPRCPTREIIREMAAFPLKFEPGTHWEYGFSLDVLAALCEEIVGERFSDYCKRVIFEPMELEMTSFGLDASLRPTMATLYNFNDEKDCYERVAGQDNFLIFGSEYDSGGAGVVSTVGDMARFVNMLALGGVNEKGVRILSPRTVELMKTNRLPKELLPDFSWDALTGYGYGLGVRTLIDKAKAGSLAPLGEFGWTGAAGAYTLSDTENRVAMYYAHHMLNNQETFTATRLKNILYSCLD